MKRKLKCISLNVLPSDRTLDILKVGVDTHNWMCVRKKNFHVFCTWSCTGFDYCVDNESLETLYWLKWGFVIMIIGYIYSQKCNENAKKKRLIYFELWKLWKHSFVYILKKKVTRIRNVITQFSLAFFLHFWL